MSEIRTDLNTTELFDLTSYNDSDSSSDYELSSKNDKRSLRNSLEKLISLYLTKLREDSVEYNHDDNNLREKRDLARYLNRRTNLIPDNCQSMRRRIGTLDQSEIERSLRNFTTTEFNIRKLLNYRSAKPWPLPFELLFLMKCPLTAFRCSGKNHCSFIFSKDHPYSMFWERGEVHIKYICMDGEFAVLIARDSNYLSLRSQFMSRRTRRVITARGWPLLIRKLCHRLIHRH
jgi:hypothetical protein